MFQAKVSFSPNILQIEVYRNKFIISGITDISVWNENMLHYSGWFIVNVYGRLKTDNLRDFSIILAKICWPINIYCCMCWCQEFIASITESNFLIIYFKFVFFLYSFHNREHSNQIIYKIQSMRWILYRSYRAFRTYRSHLKYWLQYPLTMISVTMTICLKIAGNNPSNPKILPNEDK